jgi:uncharacterized protein (UPF0212 family)
MKQLKLFSTLLTVLLGMQAPAVAAERVQVQLENNTNVRAAARTRNVLVAEYTLPAGSVVEVETEKLEEPVLMQFWNALIGKTEPKHPFVKGVKLISAPGYSKRDVFHFNSVNRAMSLYMSKRQLDESETLEAPALNKKLRTRQSSTAFRSQDVSRGSDEGSAEASKKAIERLNAANRSVRKAGAGQNTCTNCDNDFASRFIHAGVPEAALRKALEYYNKNRGRIRNSRYITINDMSEHSNQRRMYVLDMRTGAVEKHLVSHGLGSDRGHSGYVRNFGNSNYRTPSGFLLTGEAYRGNHGYSMRLDGQERHNSASRRRAIVMHPASYMSKAWMRKYGKPGRSLGCLAVDPAESRQLIDKLRGGSVVLNYTGE